MKEARTQTQRPVSFVQICKIDGYKHGSGADDAGQLWRRRGGRNVPLIAYFFVCAILSAGILSAEWGTIRKMLRRIIERHVGKS